MADPLTALVDREAPAPTNFFDPAASQGLMARYASARRGAASSEVAARSAERLAQGRLAAKSAAEDDVQIARRRVMESREDEEYPARKDAEAAADEVLKTIDQVFDPSKPDEYDQQLAEFVKTTPASVMDDPRVASYLKVKTAIADDYRQRANMEARYAASLDNAAKTLGFKDVSAAARAGVSPEVIGATFDENGMPDLVKLNYLRGETERKTKMDEFDRRQKMLQDGRLVLAEKRNLSKGGQARRTAVEKSLVTNTDAFPSKVSLLLAKTGKKTPADLEFGEYADEYRKAVAWDKDPLNYELSTARSFSDPEDYINFPGMKLTDEQKDRRRKVWEHANEQDTFEERGTAPAAPDGVVEDYVPPAKPAALPKDQWIVGKRYRGADGSVRTYKGDGKWE